MLRRIPFRSPAKRKVTPEKKAWAIAALCRRAAELGHPPRKSDFDPSEVQRVNAFLGPWPRALEAAGLEEVPERITKRQK